MRILQISNDALLARARAEFLRSVGYSVRSVKSASHLHDVISQDQYDVLMICPSTAAEEADMAIRTARSDRPGIKLIYLRAGHLGCAPAEEVDETIDALLGPLELINALVRLAKPARATGHRAS